MQSENPPRMRPDPAMPFDQAIAAPKLLRSENRDLSLGKRALAAAIAHHS
jgi:hypothetical protein